MTRTALAAFHSACDRFEGWLAANSPADHAELQPPATAEQITALEARLGFPLHPELRALLARHNGVAEERFRPAPDFFRAGNFLPLGHRLNDTDRIASEYGTVAEIAEEMEPDLSVDDDVLGRIDRWVPFAHPNDGGIAFVHHGPGPYYGYVYEMGLGSGASEPSEWATSLTELFTGLADSLETNTSFKNFYQPSVYRHASGRTALNW